MRKEVLGFSAVFAVMVALNSYSAPTWFKDVTIDSAVYYWDGSYDVWAITWQENLITGCSYSNNLKTASWWNRESAVRFDVGAARLAPAMAAVAGEIKADILIDPVTCSSTYGAMLHGVRIKK